MAPQLTYGDYSIGWISALPIELAAAQEMLDEEHSDLPQVPDDNNIYTLGRIGEHNVAIACLPAGRPGIGSAAAAAMQMKSTFHSIRFGLMVGIGGGVPSEKEDVRLGDIVVSQPGNGHGGVVQYDFGKTTPNKFERTGVLNTPPTILLAALSKLRATHDRGRGKIDLYISQIVTLPKFSREKAGADILLAGDCSHNKSSGCENCADVREVQREHRDDDTPVVHYGTIASGNQVMKYGQERDKISEEFGGVLCFEMEAAGLMDNFPCLVIRGICDYADSHKHKKWQPYAAGVAAAYAKDLLMVIPPSAVVTTKTVEEAVSTPLPFDDLHAWLNPAPFKLELARLQEYRFRDDQSHLSDPAINNWLQAERSFLQIVGPAGYGKTTLAADIIEHVSHRASTGEFVGFTFCLNLTTSAILNTILWQLVQCPHLTKAQKVLILDAYRDRGAPSSHRNDSERQSTVSLRKVVIGVLSLCQSVFLILDGVDQASAPSDFMACLSSICDPLLSQGKRFKLLVTSRHPVQGLLRFLDRVEIQTFSYTTMIVLSDTQAFLRSSLLSLEPPLPDNVREARFLGLNSEAAEGWPYSMQALATKYIKLSKLNEAETLILNVLAYREARQRENSDPILESKRLLGWIMTEQGRRKEALELQRQILDLSRHTKGAEHEMTRAVMNDLSITLIHRDATPEEVQEGITLLEMIIDVWRTPEGLETEKSLAVKSNLSIAYMEVGRFGDAEALIRRVMEESPHDADSPASLTHKTNLAQVYARQERWAEAEILDLEVLDARRRALGPDHLITIQCMSNLGWAYSHQGRLQEAKALQSEVLESRIRLQGATHPDTISILGNLAETSAKLGEMVEARRYARVALGY